ncbi:RNA-binding S4 domain-containing protein [Pararhizobium mangrovi]|uniref:RNA-binding S4 domain-containing protein n=1 Tax=Pararhizobium mangrovi TaxID=2590452 RepID=A0A506UD81_9HYPH|nr:RNA-binding S4 domain-containing protein [Pararhizobium mangrovi]
MPASQAGQRVDKWLFFARVTKSRSLAAKLAQSGRVRVNSAKIGQPSHAVKVGDVLTITLDRDVRVLEVVAPGTRRGPYSEARELYRDLTPPAPSRSERQASSPVPVREVGSGRPTKRERRQLDRMRGDDE